MTKDKKEIQLLLDKMETYSFNETKLSAKLAYEYLKRFVQLYSNIQPDKQLFISDSLSSYLRRLLLLREALIDKNYEIACRELVSLNDYEPIYQVRIYANLLRLLNEYL